MQIFGWIRRQFAEATQDGIRDGLQASGFRPVDGTEPDGAKLVLWLTGGEVKRLPAAVPPVAEFRVQTDRGAMLIAATSQHDAEEIAKKDGHKVKGDAAEPVASPKAKGRAAKS